MKGFGVLLLVVGAGLILVGVLIDPSVSNYSSYSYGGPDRVVNIQMLAVAMMLVVTGGFAFLSGSVFTAAGLLADRFAPPSDGTTA